jgi:hypothetical protein
LVEQMLNRRVNGENACGEGARSNTGISSG